MHLDYPNSKVQSVAARLGTAGESLPVPSIEGYDQRCKECPLLLQRA